MSSRIPLLAHLVVLPAVVLLMAGSAPLAAGQSPVETSPVEQVDKRTQSSKTFKNPDGTFTTRLYGSPVHFADARGDWKPISTRIVPSFEDGKAWKNEANGFEVAFAAGAEGELVRLRAGGHELGLTLEGASGGLAVPGQDGITYLGAVKGATLRYELLAEGVKETLVLGSRAAPARYRFLLDSPAIGDLRPVRYPDGSWAFVAADSPAPVFVLAAPFVAERGEPVPGKAKLDVFRLGKGFGVDLSVNLKWLRHPKREFPIELDPTILIQSGTDDASFAYGCSPPCTGVASGGELWVGTTATRAWRAAVRFDLGDLPEGADVTAATMNLYFTGSCVLGACGGSSHTLDAHLLTEAWSPASTAESLSIAGNALAGSPVLSTGDGPRWLSWDISDAVEDWVLDQEPNHGFLVQRSSESLNANGPLLASSRNAEPTLAPRLDVTYDTDGVELYVPARLHSSGADLAWSRIAGFEDEEEAALFPGYEIHRSLERHFTPSGDTLIAVVGDVDQTTYTDTTAAPERDFSYRVIVDGVPSNERTVTLPPDGLGRVEYQPDPAAGQVTFISNVEASPAGAEGEAFVGGEFIPHEPAYLTGDVVSHADGWWQAVENDPAGEPGVDPAWAAIEEWWWNDFPPTYEPGDLVYWDDAVWRALQETPGGYGSAEPGQEPTVWEEVTAEAWVEPDQSDTEMIWRSLVRFPEIPATVTIDSATLALWRPWPLAGGQTEVAVHELEAEWDEDAATWAESRPGVPWDATGGEVETTTAARFRPWMFLLSGTPARAGIATT
jgi:hypothetical protein